MPFDQIVAQTTETSTSIGSVRFRFDNGERGAFSYTVGVVSQTRPILRSLFGSRPTQCLFEDLPQ